MLSSEPPPGPMLARSSRVRGSRPSRGSGGMRGGVMAPSSSLAEGFAGNPGPAGPQWRCVDDDLRAQDPVDEPVATPGLHRPATDFGEPGVVSHFRGPFAGGPPEAALHVETPELDRFG